MGNIILGVLIPFLGTLCGAACVFFLRGELKQNIQKVLLGFAAGIMVAASIWSLILPAIEMSEHMGKLAFIPSAVGVAVGMLFLLLLDHLIPHLHPGAEKPEGIKTNLRKNTMLFFAVTLHNIPEGMAVGVVFAGLLSGEGKITLAAAVALSMGIAIQNFPEGAIISMPLRSEGKGKAFLYGTISGVVEPVAAVLTILFAGILTPILPYLLAFAAGAMLYVVVEELIPEAAGGSQSDIDLGTIGFGVGFLIMMVLDVALG